MQVCLIRVGQGRVELPTSRLSGVRSNHLSYWPSVAGVGQPLPRAGCYRRDAKASRHTLAREAEASPRSLETESYAFCRKPRGDIIRLEIEWALTLVACASLTSEGLDAESSLERR